MYKTKYNQQMKDSAQTVDKLLPKTLEMYNIAIELEKNLSDLTKQHAKTTDEEEKESLQLDIDGVTSSLEKIDAELCKKIARNQFFIENNARLAAGRQNKKDGKAKNEVKNTSTSTKPVKAAAAKSEKAENTSQTSGEKQNEASYDESNEVENEKEKPGASGSPAPTKKAQVKETEKDGKESKTNTKQIVGWTLGAVATSLLAFWGIPIPQLNKSAFSFRIKR